MNCYKIADLSYLTKSTKSFFVVKNTKRRKEENWYKKKVRVGNSATVKVRDINEKIREGKIRNMMKEMVVLYYLSHIASVLILFLFWWLVPVFYMVFIW